MPVPPPGFDADNELRCDVVNGRRKKDRLLARFREQRGQAQIEFLLTFLTIMFVIFWMWEFVMVAYTMNVLSDAAKEGVRYAIVHGTNCNQGAGCASADAIPVGCPYAGDVVRCKVWSYARLSLHDVSAMTITVSCPPSATCATFPPAAPNPVRVVVSYPFIPFTSLPVRPTLRAGSEGRMVN